MPAEIKSSKKFTYPPPADGPCVLFLCKFGCSANEAADQADRGALQGIGHCTECKVLKGNAARLHTATRAVTEGVALEPPVSLGGKLKNVSFGGFSKTPTNFFWAGSGCGRGEAEFPAGHN